MQQGLEQRRARPGGRRPSRLLVSALLAAIPLLPGSSIPAAAQSVPIGDLPSGGTITIEIVVTAPAPAPAGVDFFSTQGTVSGGNFADVATDDPDGGGADDPTITNLAAVPDLRVVKSYDPNPPNPPPTPQPGEIVAFDLDYFNDGDQDATGVTISETVPLHSTFDAGASTAGWSCADDSPAGTPCELVIGALAGGGASGAAVFAVELVDPLPPGATELVNTASIEDDGANGVDPVPGNNQSTVEITLDAIAPTLIGIDAVPATGDGALADCETVTAPVTGFTLTFSEELQDPPGNEDPNDVTNPENYLLVTAGPDATYDTFACGAIGGDDVEVPIAAVTYDAVDDLATLDAGGALGRSLHRLLLCDGLRDLAGNAIESFDRDFRADPGNLFANGHFDCDAAEWSASSSGGATFDHDPDVDGDGSPDSGSWQTLLLSPGTDPAASSIRQCLPLDGGPVALDGRVRLTAGPGEMVAVTLRCDLYANAGCTGAFAGNASATTLLGDTAGAFIDLDADLGAPGAVSGECGFHWNAAAGVAFEGWFDALTAEGPIFADGFESGDTSAWSETVP